ncbi:hypothetical protein [Brevibacterium sandarakinum]|uniref:hypothetical protein n=1 Tax=Brevibacterium sandarakinum TaxID=629680 RepID=UPI00264FFE0A|nr:hypothetical protein [Brevibacterium sandarakinum]MDN5656400.1 hypothetical protein [Brevibacterium sandarakinum]
MTVSMAAPAAEPTAGPTAGPTVRSKTFPDEAADTSDSQGYAADRPECRTHSRIADRHASDPLTVAILPVPHERRRFSNQADQEREHHDAEYRGGPRPEPQAINQPCGDHTCR